MNFVTNFALIYLLTII